MPSRSAAPLRPFRPPGRVFDLDPTPQQPEARVIRVGRVSVNRGERAEALLDALASAGWTVELDHRGELVYIVPDSPENHTETRDFRVQLAGLAENVQNDPPP